MPHSAIDYRTVFSAMPGASGLLLPDAPRFTIVASTNEFAAFAGAKMDEFVGSSLFKFFPDNPNAPVVSNDIRASLDKCIQTKQKSELPIQRYDLTDENGTFREMYWTVIHTPILDENGEISFIIHTAVDKTDHFLAEVKDERLKALEKVHKLFMQSTVAIHIFSGPEMRITLANAPTLEIWAKDESVIGKPLLEVLPELAGQKYPEIIHKVRETGEPYIAHEAPVILNRNGVQSTIYFNFILQPYYDEDETKASGVVAMVNNVSDIIDSRKALAEKEKSLELAVEIGDLGTFNIDPATNIINCSPQIMEWFGLEKSSLPLSELFRKLHPDDVAKVSETLRMIQAEGNQKHDVVFRVPNPKTGKLQFLRSIGQLQMEDGQAISLSGIVQDITNVVRSGEEVKDSEQRLLSFIESAPFPIGIYIGREMRVEMANQALIDVWGKGPDVVGKTYYEVLPELSGTGVYENLDAVFTTGIAYNANHQQVNLVVNGELRPFYFNYSFTPLFDADGKVYGVMNTAASVTDLVLAKKGVEESEYRYRTLIEESSVAAALYLGRNLEIRYANEIMLSYWGKDVSVIGKTLADAVPELRGQPFLAFLDHVYKTGQNYSGVREKALLDVGNGLEEFYFNFTYKPLRDVNGEIYGIHHMAVNVTSEVLAQKAVEESERNFRNMILQAPVAICILRGENHVFENVNRLMEDLVGHKAHEIQGKPIFEGMPELLANGLKPMLRRVFDEGISYVSDEQEFQLLRDGEFESAYIRYIYEPMFDVSGHVEGIMVVATDVTQQVLARRKIEDIVSKRTRELADTNDRLQRSNAELEQFAYIASHDLQEPLRKISLFSQMLESSLGEIPDRAKNHMDRINNSVGRMTNLIRDILGYSQLSRKNERFVTTNLEKVFDEAVADFDLVLQEKNGAITHGPLPQIEAIPLQMVQLFNNLISNSLKYTRPDVGPRIDITSSVLSPEETAEHNLPQKESGYIRLSFRDNGIGFQQEYADKIFQIFQRLHGKMQFEGTGIGLAMCRKIAQNHNGIIYAVGKENQGAEFVIILPVEHPSS